jgi:periplasmic copper chaperone A
MKTGSMLLAPLAMLAACQAPKQVAVDHAWVRLAAVPTNPSAAYFTVEGGPKDETLTAVSTPIAIRAEMHESVTAGGIMTMAPVKLVAVRAGGRESFAPGGRHVMLFGLKPVQPGGTIPLTLTFASGHEVTVDAKVVAAGDAAPGE